MDQLIAAHAHVIGPRGLSGGGGITFRRPDGAPAWSSALIGAAPSGALYHLRVDGNRGGNPDAVKHHGVLLQGGAWVIRDVEVFDNAHGGLYLHRDAQAEIEGLRGRNNGFGDLVCTGAGQHVRARKLDVAMVNIEIEEQGAPGFWRIEASRAGDLGVLTLNVGDTFEAEGLEATSGSLIQKDWGHATYTRCTFSGGLLVQFPRLVVFRSCELGDVHILAQTRFLAPDPAGQIVVFDRCTLRSLRVSGGVQLLTRGTTLPEGATFERSATFEDGTYRQPRKVVEVP